jgi:hypothetical protein
VDFAAADRASEAPLRREFAMRTLMFLEPSEVTMHTQTETHSSSPFEAGREAQFRQMMEQLAQLQSKYKGVRGELLQKVREELMRSRPGSAPRSLPEPAPTPQPVRAAPQVARPTPPEQMLPSCRVCGRGMKLDGAEGKLVCSRGHVRLLT